MGLVTRLYVRLSTNSFPGDPGYLRLLRWRISRHTEALRMVLAPAPGLPTLLGGDTLPA